MILEHKGDHDACMKSLISDPMNTVFTIDGSEIDARQLSLQTLLEMLGALAVLRRFELGLFAVIMEKCNLSWDGLFRIYLDKHILNMVRQERGYKDGSYVKIWAGREDNEHLTEISSQLDPKIAGYKEAVYAALNKRYVELNS